MEERLDRIESEMATDPMAALENQTTDAKVEMDILDKLQDIRTRNARTERADVDAVLDRISSRAPDDYLTQAAKAELEKFRQEEEEDEAEVRRVFGKVNAATTGSTVQNAYGNGLQSIELDEELDPNEAMPSLGGPPDRPIASTSASGGASPAASASSSNGGGGGGGGSVKRRLEETEPDATSLLSADQQKWASENKSAAANPPPLSKKKRNAAMASKLGIKRKE